ncbi:MAG: hypothetical protein KN64_08030 [Sulfurovum sp. AS07-7]|nr:MAG: hypothetical protein KN64_08030 [Sulfurovum sp. AS07-7]
MKKIVILAFLALNAHAQYQYTISEIPQSIQQSMYVSGAIKEGCPVSFDELRYVTMDYYGRDGKTHTGAMVVHQELSQDVVEIFGDLYAMQYPIKSIKLIDEFGANDRASMRANNTSSFNCRVVAGSSHWSDHAKGRAIDINPFHNPYVIGDYVSPKEASKYKNRKIKEPELIRHGDKVYDIFISKGWSWGGDWARTKDYQHFYKK